MIQEMWNSKIGYILICVFVCLLVSKCQCMNPIKNDNVPLKPNIVVIMADDMGFNDLSVFGSDQIFTPNIDALGYQGVILQRHYVPNLCTPSRAAFLTGKYPIHTGTQHAVISSDQPWSLPLQEKLMPEFFQEIGYQTHLVGKWHLGMARKAFTPTLRGFDTHYGYLGPYIDYYDHSLIMLDKNYSRGYDMRKNEKVFYDSNGTYATNLFTDAAVKVIQNHQSARGPLFLLLNHLAVHTGNEDNPMQAPADEIAKFSYIKDPNRRVYAAMLSLLDQGVGKVVNALKERDFLNNTVILFYADNGAPTIGLHANAGSNYPFRGQKESPWEGGIRGAATLWSATLQSRHRVADQLIHNVDWLPTLGSLAGIQFEESLKLDGINIWAALSLNETSSRTDILHNIDLKTGYTSYFKDGWKYINGTTYGGIYDTWLGEIGTNENPNGSSYFENLRSSDTWTSLASFSQSILTSIDIDMIRRSAMITCLSSNKSIELNKCEPLKAPCLFHLDTDPCEENNLANLRPDQLIIMKQNVEKYIRSSVQQLNQPADPQCNPADFNYTWTWWLDEIDAKSNQFGETTIIIISILAVIVLIGISLYIWEKRSVMKKEHL